MDYPALSVSEILARVAPSLEWVFAEFGLTAEQAERLIEDVCRIYVVKRKKPQDPEKWLIVTVIERCRRLQRETTREDPSA